MAVKISAVKADSAIVIGGLATSVLIKGEDLDMQGLVAQVLDENGKAVDTTVVVVQPSPGGAFPNEFPVTISATKPPDGWRAVAVLHNSERITHGKCPANSSTCFIYPAGIKIEP